MSDCCFGVSPVNYPDPDPQGRVAVYRNREIHLSVTPFMIKNVLACTNRTDINSIKVNGNRGSYICGNFI